MKTNDALDLIFRVIRHSVEEKRHTGQIDIHADCSQGNICDIKIAVTEKKVTVFGMGNQEEKKGIDNFLKS